jgi:phosphoribosylformylglycinamidine synthase
MELCPALGIAIPVGKDSMSMKTVWQDNGQAHSVTAPLSLIISAFARVQDVRNTMTPELHRSEDFTALLLIDLGRGQNRLGGSCLAQVYKALGETPPDLDEPQLLIDFFNAIQSLNTQGMVLAYHDRSDGGALITLLEMAFAAHCGLDIDAGQFGTDMLPALFNEELGAVIQVREQELDKVMQILEQHQLATHTRQLARLNDQDTIRVLNGGKTVFEAARVELQRIWWQTSFEMQSLRDNADCAREEFDALLVANDPGLHASLSFNPADDVAAPYINSGARPKMMILREQGVNGHVEMAAAFDRAGFDCVDVHMSDVISSRVSLSDFKGMVACGGFSYGDVLGAGGGWASSILYNAQARDAFAAFFHRTDTFGLGVCNGCQMMSHLKDLIPGAQLWPSFKRNLSEQFEARFVMSEILDSPSVLLKGMLGSRIPIVVAHGEGRAQFADNASQQSLLANKLLGLRYVDNFDNVAERYPFNPNGSPMGIAGVTTLDGRFTIMMPHPERVFRTVQNSWHPDSWGEDAPWMRMFRNARLFVD